MKIEGAVTAMISEYPFNHYNNIHFIFNLGSVSLL